jgi:PAS domain S-box-containing protein
MFASIICGTFLEFLLPGSNDFTKIIAGASDVSVLFWVLGIFYLMLRYRFMALSPATTAEDIVNNMSEALIILDENFYIVFYNSAALQLLECEGQYLENKTFLKFFINSNIANYWLKETIKRSIFKGYETSLLRKTGKNVSVILSSSLIMKDGDMTGVVCIVSDITLQKLAEQKIQESYNELKSLDILKANFISMVSHELRTPLTSIKGFISLLIGGGAGNVTDKQKEFLEIANNNSNRLLMLINEILDVSKMNSGTFCIQKSDYDIIEIVNDSIRDINPIIEKKEITVIREMPFSVLHMYVDGYRISQAIINLLSNSIKFSPCKSKITFGITEYSIEKLSLPAEIKGLMVPEKEYIAFYIKDEGLGLTQKQKENIFSKFYQADSGTNKAPGTGLGLYITKNIVEQHDGFTWADSEGHGKGTTFYILLPTK